MDIEARILKFKEVCKNNNYEFVYSEDDGIATASILKFDTKTDGTHLVTEWEMEVETDTDREYFLELINKDLSDTVDMLSKYTNENNDFGYLN